MNPASIEHLARARQESMALRGAGEAILYGHDGTRPGWRITHWLVTRGFAQGRASSAAARFLRATTVDTLHAAIGPPIDAPRSELPQVTSLRLALVQLERAVLAAELTPSSGIQGAVGVTADVITGIAELQLAERDLIGDADVLNWEGPAGEQAARDLIHDRVWHRVLTDQIARGYGVDVARSVANTFRARVTEERLTHLDRSLRDAIDHRPDAQDYARHLTDEFFTPLDERPMLPGESAELQAVAAEALGGLQRRVGLDTDPLTANDMPWLGQGREEWI
jgi:hypothetical protein